jgi:dipeptidyl aminopeptidase/acylaminoacyl peptidase
MSSLRFVRLLALLAVSAGTVIAQPTRPITQDTYDEWKSLTGATLSPNGAWAAWTHTPVMGDGFAVVRATGGTAEYRVPRGWTGRPNMRVVITAGLDSNPSFQAPPIRFTGDSRYAAFLGFAPKAEFDAATKARRRPADQPKSALVLVRTADGRITRVPRVKSFQIARDGGKFLAYLLEADSGAAPARPNGGPGANGQAVANAAPRKEPGTTLVLRNLDDDSEVRIADVTAFAFDDAERWLGYTTSGSDGSKDGAWVRALATGVTTPLATGKGNYKLMAFDRAGTQAAFVTDRDDSTAIKPRYALYYAALAARGREAAPTPARRAVSADIGGDTMRIADRGPLAFTRSGAALVFPLAPVIPDSVPTDSIAEKAIYDLWHWKDTKIQPQQRVDAARDRARTWAAVYHPAQNAFVRLGSDSLTQVQVSDDAKAVLALNAVQYAIEQFWGDGGADVYVLDPRTAARTLVAKRVEFGAQLSPSGKFVTYWQNGWQAYEIAGKKTVPLTAKIAGVRFDNELSDTPDTPPPYGLGGWTTGDARVLVYDRFDVWETDPTGVAAPRNLTEGSGRRGNLTYRVVDLDPEDRFFDPAQPLLLRGFDNTTKASGYLTDAFTGSAEPQKLVWGDKAFNQLQKARKGTQMMLTASTYTEFPNLWTGTSLGQLTKLSDANPQDREYPRGSVELVSWMSEDGVPLQGLLYKPANFDPQKKYPMVTYFYERLSDGLHSYVAPTGRNVVNPMVYNAEGYLVFEPDIVYTDGFPGPSAAKAIIPGVLSLIAKGFVDEKRLGITGQSWGGYQTAYLITVTDLFAAAVPNATVVNMTSAYGGIRWGSGLARAFQYEVGQSRIAGSLWERPERFIENSPLFKLDRVKTPVLFMANDADGAVPWYQGIEFYVAMRRLQKEAYMVVYNGDDHNPTKRANQKDIDRKMLDFFGHKLQGKPAPSWMTRGIPFLEKGRDQLAPAAPK